MNPIVQITPPSGDQTSLRDVTFLDAAGNAVGHFTGTLHAIIENTPSGSTWVEGHKPMNHAPPPSEEEVKQAITQQMLTNMERQSLRTLREAILGDQAALERLRDVDADITNRAVAAGLRRVIE